VEPSLSTKKIEQQIDTGVRIEDVGEIYGVEKEWAITGLPKTFTVVKGVAPSDTPIDFSGTGGESFTFDENYASKFAKEGHIVTKKLTPENALSVHSAKAQEVFKKLGLPFQEQFLNSLSLEQRRVLESEMVKEGVDVLYDLKYGEVTSYQPRDEFAIAEANRYKGNKLYLQPGENAYVVLKGNQEVAMLKTRGGEPVDTGTGDEIALKYLRGQLGIEISGEQWISQTEAEEKVKTTPPIIVAPTPTEEVAPTQEPIVIPTPMIEDLQKFVQEKIIQPEETKPTIKVGDIIKPAQKVIKLTSEQINEARALAKKKGYAFSSQLISSDQIVIGKPVQTEKVEIKPIEVGKTYRINNINFATNSFDLTQEITTVLNEFLTFLKENPTVKIAIQGHTDNVGIEKENLLLSQNRAKEVYNYLILEDIDPSRLSYKGFGSSKPIADNNTEEGKAKNRRTEFVVVKK